MIPINKFTLLKNLEKTSKYNDNEKLLLKMIVQFYKNNIQTKKCLEEKPFKNKLRNLLCLFVNEYSPEGSPDHQKLVLLDKILGKGSYGAVYESNTFKDIPIVTKTFFNFSSNNLYEIYVSFVLINKILLLHPILCENLIPTYGLFLCGHEYKKNNSLKSICNNENKYIHLVQKRIFGKTLDYYLDNNLLTLLEFQKILKKIFYVLTILNENYFLSHNDLHGNNILIDDFLNPYIIDFGFADFKVGSSYYYGSDIKKYSNMDITSGLYDIIFIIYSVRSDNKDIIKYCKKIENKVLGSLLETPNKKFHKTKYKKYYRIYKTLIEIDSSLSETDKEIVHSHNLKTIKKMTYKYIAENII
jgi:hypothetical protein